MTSTSKKTIYKEYNPNEQVLIGNYFYYAGDYELPIRANKVLSPYNPIEIQWKKDKYPSMMNYLISFRLCYRNLKKRLQENVKPADVNNFYNRNRDNCDQIFKNKSIELGIGKFENVKSYFIKITNDALNVLYDVVDSNQSLKRALIDTDEKPIVFIDSDDILGDGRDGKGLNLYGKKLEEIRSYFMQKIVKNSKIDQKLTKIENLDIKSDANISEYDTEEFSELEKWAFKMLLMYCNATAKFFEYLCLNRNDFIPVMKGAIDITDKEDHFVLEGKYETLQKQFKAIGGESIRKGWKFPLNIKDEVYKILYSSSAVGVKPVLNMNVVSYTIREIFHCSFAGEFNMVKFADVKPSFCSAVTLIIKSFISDKSLRNVMSVPVESCGLLWRHLCMLCEHLYEVMLVQDTSDINKVISSSQTNVENLKREFVDHGLNTDLENCALQSVVYNIVALTDWLGTYDVTLQEVNTCVDIMSYGMERLKKYREDSGEEVMNVTRAFTNKGLVISRKVASYVLGFVKKLISESSKDKEVMNRIMFFSNII